MVEYFKAGGICMWPLLACLIIAIAYIIERIISFSLSRVDAKQFTEEIKNRIRGGDVEKGINYAHSCRGPLARITEAALITYSKVGPQKDVLEESVSNAGRSELAFLDRGLNILAAISVVAPIIGFLGTVTGMIHAFNAIAIAGEVEPTLVASGISEALITTQAGLFIAIIAVFGHLSFSTRSNNYTRAMEDSATDLITFLMEEKP